MRRSIRARGSACRGQRERDGSRGQTDDPDHGGRRRARGAVAAGSPDRADAGAGPGRRRAAGRDRPPFEALYFALRNPKLLIGLGIVCMCLCSPCSVRTRRRSPLAFGRSRARGAFGRRIGSARRRRARTSSRSSSTACARVPRRRARRRARGVDRDVRRLHVPGYRGGIVDEILNMLTNVVLVIPTLAVLIIVAAYCEDQGLRRRGALHRADVVAVGGARGARADVLAGLARLRRHRAAERPAQPGRSSPREIAPNMSSYLLMMFILLFGGAILIGATLDFIGLGPSNAMSLGLDDEQRRAVECAAARQLVVVHPAGRRDHGDRRRALHHERRASTRSSTRSCATREPMSLHVDNLKVYYRTLQRRRAGAGRRHVRRSPTARSWGSRASRAAASRHSASSLIRLDGRMQLRRRPRRCSTAASCRSGTTAR